MQVTKHPEGVRNRPTCCILLPSIVGEMKSSCRFLRSPHFTVDVSIPAPPPANFAESPSTLSKLQRSPAAPTLTLSRSSPNLPPPSRIPPPPLPVLHRLRCPTTVALQRPVPRQLSLLHPLIPIHPPWRLVSGSTSGGDVSPRGCTQGHAATGP
jgi:hypothetical protein